MKTQEQFRQDAFQGILRRVVDQLMGVLRRLLERRLRKSRTSSQVGWAYSHFNGLL